MSFIAPDAKRILFASFSDIPEWLQDLRRWALYRIRDGDLRIVSVYHTPCSASDIESWSDFECVVLRCDNELFDGVGAFLTPLEQMCAYSNKKPTTVDAAVGRSFVPLVGSSVG